MAYFEYQYPCANWMNTFQISLILFFLDNKLFDAVSELRHEILLLTIQNEKLRQESLQNGQGSSEGKAPEKSSVSNIWKRIDGN